MNVNSETSPPWLPGSELRILVDNAEVPDMNYLPCIPVAGSSVLEIPNTDWITYIGPVHISSDSTLYKFQYHKNEVYISPALFEYLIHIPRRPKFKINKPWRKNRK